MSVARVILPQLSVNDEEVLLVRWLKSDREPVREGDAICTIETSKAASDLVADAAGFLRTVLAEGRRHRVGAVAAFITAGPDDPLPAAEAPDDGARSAAADRDDPAGFEGRRVTTKAAYVARTLGVDLATIAGEGPITEAMVRAAAAGKAGRDPARAVVSRGARERVLVLGGGRGASLVLDILAQTPFQTAVGILDDDPALGGQQVDGVPVLGPIDAGRDVLSRWEFDSVVITFGGATRRRAELFETLHDAGATFANVVHPQALVDPATVIGVGNVILSFVRIGPHVTIGDNNFISAFCNFEHHCALGDHCTFGPAVFLSGSVQIGSGVLFGTGIHIEPKVEIGDDSVIASGVTLTRHVPARHVVRPPDAPTIRPIDAPGR